MKQISIVEDLENKQFMFRLFCEEKGLKNGDTYYSIDFLNWCDDKDARFYKEVKNERD